MSSLNDAFSRRTARGIAPACLSREWKQSRCEDLTGASSSLRQGKADTILVGYYSCSWFQWVKPLRFALSSPTPIVNLASVNQHISHGLPTFTDQSDVFGHQTPIHISFVVNSIYYWCLHFSGRTVQSYHRQNLKSLRAWRLCTVARSARYIRLKRNTVKGRWG